MNKELNPSIQTSSSIPAPEKDVAILAMGASIALIGKVLGRGLYAITEIVLARLLGPASFGLYAIGTTILRIFGTIGMLGLQNGVIRFGAKYWRQSASDLKSTLVSSLGLALLSGITLGSLLFILTPWLAEEVFKKPNLIIVLRGVAILFPLFIGLGVAAAATRISKRIKYSALSEDIVQPAVNLLLIIAFSLYQLSLDNAVFSIVVSFGFALVVSLYYLIKLFPEVITAKFGKEFVFKDLLFYSVPTGLAGSFLLLTGWFSRLFIGYYRLAEEVGIYQAVSQISILFVIILNSFNQIFAPMIADLFFRHEMKRIESLYRISTKWGLYLILPLYFVILLFPQQLLTTIFGDVYTSGALAMVILASTQVVNVGTGGVGFLMTMTGHQNYWFITSGSTMLLNVILSIYLVPRFGMTGAAVATAASVSSLYLAGLIEVKIFLGLIPYDRRYIKGIIASGLTIAILVIIGRLIHVQYSLAEVVISLAASYGSFILVLLILGLEVEDREFIRVIVARLKLN